MVFAIIATLFVGIQDPIIQKFAVRFVGGYLSEKTGADIKVGRLVVTPDFNVMIEDAVVKDLRNNDLANIYRLRAKIYVTELLEGKIHFGRVLLRDTKANLVQYEGEDFFNFQFLADFFSSGNEKEKSAKPLMLQIDNILIVNLDFLMWNQNSDKPELTAQNAIDYSHLDIDSISLSAKNLQIIGDSIHTVIEMLRAKEMSGFNLKMLQSDVIVGQSGIYLTDLQMELNNSLIHTDLNMLYNGFGAFKSFVDSVRFDATIYPTDVVLSDIGVFSPVMYQMPNRVFFEGRFTGPIAHFSVDNINARIGKSTSFQGSISMHPLDFNDGEHKLNIKKLRFTYDDIVNFHIPGAQGTVPLPESLSAMKSGTASVNFKGSYNNFSSVIHMLSEIGNVDLDVKRKKMANGDNIISGNIKSDRFNAGLLANASKFVGCLDLNADFSAKFPRNGDIDLTVNGKAYRAQLLGNHIDEVVLNGDMKDGRFAGKLNIDDDELGLDFDGVIDFTDKKYPKADFTAVISHADLSALKLMKNDSISEVSTSIVANLTGFDLDVMEGELHLENTTFHDSRGTYHMSYFDASIVNDNLMDRRINLTNDFFDFEMAGKMNFANMMNSFNEYGDYFVHFPIFEKNQEEFQEYKLKNDVEQDFIVSLTLKDTKTLSRLFMPNLKIAKNTSVNCTFTSKSRQFNLTARTQSIKIGDLNINDLVLRNFNGPTAAFGSLSIGEIAWTNITKTDTISYGLDNLLLSSKMADDTITARINWDNQSEEVRNHAAIETCFHPHEDGGIFTIKNGDICINDTLWQFSPNNFVDFSQGRITLSNLMLGHRDQFVRVDGYVPKQEHDTLAVQFHAFDISNFDILFERMGFDIDGLVSGEAFLSNLKEKPMVLADLTINRLGMDGGQIGDATIRSAWDHENKAVDLTVDIIDQRKQTLDVSGHYYTARQTDNLDFKIEMDSLRLNVLTPILAGAVSRMQGYAEGWATVTGSLKQPILDGKIKVIDGGCKVGYLNTFYSFEPTISLNSQEILLKDLVLVDTVGNRAMVDGKITHDHLKNFNLDLTLYPRQFLAMATTAKDNDTFYGSVIANGLVKVKGPFNDILLSVKAMTQKGTKVVIPIQHSTTVKDNDFIVFVQPPKEVDEEEDVQPQEEEKNKKKSNLTINLDVDVNDQADLRITLPGIGILDATGNGNIKIGTSSSTPLSLIGDYMIANGHFQLNFKDVLTRDFNLKKGGTIVFTGDPTNGRIDATGAYNVKTSLASLGVQVDSTASTSTNVNVECLIHLKDALLNPTITFGMNLPNASEDVAQTVFTLIDTTNQAVMTSQALSLLILGSFSYAGNTANNNSTNYLGVLTSNLLFSALSVNITDNVNVGLRYHTSNSSDNYEEYQIAMKSEFFDNRLTIESNVGVVSNNGGNSGNASNLIGEFDVYYKLTEDGRLQAHFYNHSNYNTNYSTFAFDRLAPYTQGLGLSYSRSFDRFADLFRKKKSLVPGTGPMMGKPKGKDNP